MHVKNGKFYQAYSMIGSPCHSTPRLFLCYMYGKGCHSFETTVEVTFRQHFLQPNIELLESFESGITSFTFIQGILLFHFGFQTASLYIPSKMKIDTD